MPRATRATRIVYIYLLKMQLAACFKHLPDSVGTQIMSLKVHAVSKNALTLKVLVATIDALGHFETG